MSATSQPKTQTDFPKTEKIKQGGPPVMTCLRLWQGTFLVEGLSSSYRLRKGEEEKRLVHLIIKEDIYRKGLWHVEVINE